LQYEGTKGEIAQGFKERGNEMVKEKAWRDANEFYTKGIALLTDKAVDRWEKADDLEAEAKKERDLEEQIYVNRALCNLELSEGINATVGQLSDEHQRITAPQRWIVLQHCGSTHQMSRHSTVLLLLS
jgi:hypothetical protein